jgi:uncharacterized protein YkwD
MKCSATILALMLLAVSTAGAQPDLEATADRIFEGLREVRAKAGHPALRRAEVLDAVALERAREIAARPHRKRLAGRAPVEKALEEAGVRDWLHVFEHLDLKRGYQVPSEAFLQTLSTSKKLWGAVLDPDTTACGLALAAGEDGWLVFVVVLVERRGPPPNLEALERRTVAAINDVRRERGLAPLKSLPALAEVARAHSEDMARLDYFAHRSPAGTEPHDRVQRHGIPYRRLAENIQLNNDAYDPVRVAVDSWMSSTGHRRNIVDPGFTRTGVGVARTEDGVLYFTQLFMETP